jgi:Protein of unknown function (DUF3616)
MRMVWPSVVLSDAASGVMALAAIVLLPAPGVAQVCQPVPGASWTVNGLPPVTKKITYAKNLSGLACTAASSGSATCVLVHDEDFVAAAVRLTPGKIDVVRLFDLPRSPAPSDTKKTIEFDAEAAVVVGGQVYVLGSHSQGGKRCESNASSRALVRFPVAQLTQGAITFERSKPIAALVATLPQLKDRLGACVGTDAYDPPNAKGLQGINFEGLAILENRVFLGLRGPVLGGMAQIVETRLDHLFGPAQPETRAHGVQLTPAGGVRDLAALGADVLILSGREDDKTGDAAIHLWDGKSRTAATLCAIPDPPSGSKDKPEALHVLGTDGRSIRVLILSDGAEGGNPREFLVSRP